MFACSIVRLVAWRIASVFFLVVCDCLFDFIFYMKVFADLLVDSQQILMVTVAAALQEIGYEIQVVSFVCFFHLEYGCEESRQCF